MNIIQSNLIVLNKKKKDFFIIILKNFQANVMIINSRSFNEITFINSKEMGAV